MKAAVVAGIVVLAATAGAYAKSASYMSSAGQPPRMMTSEPANGTLKFGQIVYVDDHSCPLGQIKQITGGNTAKGVQRSKECVAH